MRFFAPDSKFMQTMNRLTDLILLNCIFLLSSIPVFTIGAAATAMYTVIFRMGTDKEAGVMKAYFRAFRENFKQSTILWLLLLAGGLCTFFDVVLLRQMTGPVRFLFLPFAALLLLIVLVSSYLFPLLSQFNNTGRQSLKNALILSLGYLPRSLVMGALNVFPFVILLSNMMFFMEASFFWVFLYFSAAAYFNTLLLKKVFKPYWSEEEDAE